MPFQLSFNDGQSWLTPNRYSAPDAAQPPVVRYPDRQASTGKGQPCRFVGSPFALVGRQSISQTGMDWWLSSFPAGASTTRVQVKLLDMTTGTWRTFRADMNRPQVGRQAKVKNTVSIYGFLVRFDNLEVV